MRLAQLKSTPNSSPNRLRQGMAKPLATLCAEFFCRLWKELLLLPFRITGAQHEFATLTGIVEDVTDIVLNLKKIKFKAVDHEPRTVTINVNKEGQITAGDIQTIQGIEVLNTNQVICTVDKKQKVEAEFDVRIGRGFFTGDENKRADMLLGVIPIDSIFSPVIRVKYSVENTRVGHRTDYDKLILEIWTDGR